MTAKTSTLGLDYEIEMYKLLDRAKKADVYKFFKVMATKTLKIFGNVYGYGDHVDETDPVTLAEEIIVCLDQVIESDENVAKIFDVFTNEEDQSCIVAMLLGLIWEPDDEEVEDLTDEDILELSHVNDNLTDEDLADFEDDEDEDEGEKRNG